MTAMEFTLFPVTRLYAGNLCYAGEDADQVLRAAVLTLTFTTPGEAARSAASGTELTERLAPRPGDRRHPTFLSHADAVEGGRRRRTPRRPTGGCGR